MNCGDYKYPFFCKIIKPSPKPQPAIQIQSSPAPAVCYCSVHSCVTDRKARSLQRSVVRGFLFREPDNGQIRFPSLFDAWWLQYHLQSDRVIRHQPNSAAIATSCFRKVLKTYIFCISSSKSGCRSMSFNNFTSGAGGRVSPRSYRENAT